MDITKYRLKIVFKKPILGTRPQKATAKEFIVAKFAERASANGEDIPTGLDGLPLDEVDSLDESLKRGTTAFPKLGGRPIAFDMQVKGFLKASGKIHNGERDVKALEDKVRNLIFVYPRILPFHLPPTMLVPEEWQDGTLTLSDEALEELDNSMEAWLFESGPIPPGYKKVPAAMLMCDRPLRAETMKGPRTTVTISEQLPAGTWIECSLTVLGGKISEPLLRDMLDYGAHQGMLQWRGAGFGSFRYELEKTFQSKKLE